MKIRNQTPARFFASVFVFLWMLLPAVTLACASSSDCSDGTYCVSGNCIGITAGVGCSSTKNGDCDPNTTGLYCNTEAGICAVSPSTSSSSGSDSGTTGTTGTTNTSATCTQGSCPTSDLCYVNGLCVPKSNFTTGIASSSSLTGLLINVIKLLLTLSGIIAIGALVIGGYFYITSGGNEETAEKGKKIIINAVIGLIVILFSYAIVTILVSELLNSKYTTS